MGRLSPPAPRIELDRAVTEALARKVAGYLRDEFDADCAPFDAVRLIDFLAEHLGPHFYNQGLYDAQAVLRAKLDDLSDAIGALEKPVRA